MYTSEKSATLEALPKSSRELYQEVSTEIKNQLKDYEEELENLLIHKNHENLNLSTSPFLNKGHLYAFFKMDNKIVSLINQEIGNDFNLIYSIESYILNYPENVFDKLEHYQQFSAYLEGKVQPIDKTKSSQEIVMIIRRNKAVTILKSNIDKIANFIKIYTDEYSQNQVSPIQEIQI